MRYPAGLVYETTKHVVSNKLRGKRRFPLALTLDPLGASMEVYPTLVNLQQDSAEAGSAGMLTVEQCLAALEDCCAPIVNISGGEPLEYPEIANLTREILARGKHLFLNTDGSLIRRRLHMIPPETNFFWNVRLDGTAKVHDKRSGQDGLYTEALDGIKAAKNAGFFVVVTTAVYPDTDVDDVAQLFETLHNMHVDGYFLEPVYVSGWLSGKYNGNFRVELQKRFCGLKPVLQSYNCLVSPVYLEYLCGERELDCCAWASPVYGPKGWSQPCHRLNEGFEKSYRELLENTAWENTGRGMEPACENCMSHNGYASAAWLGTNRKAGDTWKMLAWQFGGGLGEKREGAVKG